MTTQTFLGALAVITIDSLERKHPGTRWLRNRRYVADGNVITTSGVSTSIPISVALVEAIAGRGRAEEVARTLVSCQA